MFNRRVTALVVVAFALAAIDATTLQAAQQGSVGGTVIAEETLLPIEGALVLIMGAADSSITDAAGGFLLSGVPVGEVTVRVEYEGYVTLTEVLDLTPGESVLLNFRLPGIAAALDALIVQAQSNEVRNDQGFADGTIEVPDNTSSLTAADLLVGTIPGLSTSLTSGLVGGGTGVRIRGVSSISLSDAPTLYVDGVRVGNQTSDHRGGEGVLQVLQEIPAHSVVRIRVLRGPAAAAAYPLAKNGVILVETRR